MAHSRGKNPVHLSRFGCTIPYSMMTSSGVLKNLRKAYSDILPQAVTQAQAWIQRTIDLVKNEWSDLLQDSFSPQSALSKQGIISKSQGKGVYAPES